MPGISSGRLGAGSILGIPGKKFGAPQPNVANALTVSSKPFRSKQGQHNLVLFGTSMDQFGNVLGGCTVMVFNSSTHAFIGQVVSDANGYWQYFLPLSAGEGPFFLVEYLAGIGATPAVAGTSVNTLMGL